MSSGSCLTTTWASQIPHAPTNKINAVPIIRIFMSKALDKPICQIGPWQVRKVALLVSTKIGLTRHACSGARRKAPYLISIAACRGDQLDFALPARAVIHQQGRTGSKLAFHRLLFNDNLRSAHPARGNYGS
jgi:hypothetical protein